MKMIASNRGTSDPDKLNGGQHGSAPDLAEGIRRQAEEIIQAVIASGPEPHIHKLKALVAESPDRPEAALAQFLGEVRSRISDYNSTED